MLCRAILNVQDIWDGENNDRLHHAFWIQDSGPETRSDLNYIGQWRYPPMFDSTHTYLTRLEWLNWTGGNSTDNSSAKYAAVEQYTARPLSCLLNMLFDIIATSDATLQRNNHNRLAVRPRCILWRRRDLNIPATPHKTHIRTCVWRYLAPVHYARNSCCCCGCCRRSLIFLLEHFADRSSMQTPRKDCVNVTTF